MKEVHLNVKRNRIRELSLLLGILAGDWGWGNHEKKSWIRVWKILKMFPISFGIRFPSPLESDTRCVSPNEFQISWSSSKMTRIKRSVKGKPGWTVVFGFHLGEWFLVCFLYEIILGMVLKIMKQILPIWYLCLFFLLSYNLSLQPETYSFNYGLILDFKLKRNII